MRRRVRLVVLYSVDFVPRRFQSQLLNLIYHAVDSFAVRNVDVVWSVSDQIVSARLERDGHGPRSLQMIVPHGANFERVTRIPLESVDPYRIGFLGHLVEKQGVQIVIEALPKIRARVPAATLTVIGDGAYAAHLKKLSSQLDLNNAVEFTGVIQDHRLVETRLAGCALAVAPYVPDPHSFTRFADPGKIKTYLACGLPVVLTAVPPIAELIESRGAGHIVDYDVDKIAAVITEYLTNNVMLSQARAAATELGAEFEWSLIFSEAWSRMMAQTQKTGKPVRVVNHAPTIDR
jgi:glycosyltransferase involved in cell wall biosynthesis